MDATYFKDIASILQSIVTTLAIIIAGIWALSKFVFHKEYFPRVDFSVNVNFVGIHNGEWLIEILGLLDNKGLVPHRVESLRFELRYLSETDPLTDGDETIRGQVLFPPATKDESWMPIAEGEKMVIQSGVSLRYNYVYRIPETAAFVLLHGILDYGKNRPQHRADRMLKVPNSQIMQSVSGITIDKSL